MPRECFGVFDAEIGMLLRRAARLAGHLESGTTDAALLARLAPDGD
jgi:hypothetical protein